MADELVRTYFEKLKIAEKQILELQLELAAKNTLTPHATSAVASSHGALQQKVSELEEDNARLRDHINVANGAFEDEDDPIEDEDEDEAQVVMCDCGIDLLAQMQENRALQNDLKTERLKFQVIQGQVKNLRKQVAERDERISNLTAQTVVQVKQEPKESPVEPSAKRKRTDIDNSPSTRAAASGGLSSIPLAAQDYRQHPARAAMTGNIQPLQRHSAFSLPTPVQTPMPMLNGQFLYTAPSTMMDPFDMFMPSVVPQPPASTPFDYNWNTPVATNMMPGQSASSSVQAARRVATPATHPDRAKLVRQESTIASAPTAHPGRAKLVRQESTLARKELESPASPQDSSTESESDGLDGPTDITVNGFPSNWKLQKIRQYLLEYGITPLSVRRPQMPFAHMTFSVRQDATAAMECLDGMSIDGKLLSVCFTNT